MRRLVRLNPGDPYSKLSAGTWNHLVDYVQTHNEVNRPSQAPALTGAATMVLGRNVAGVNVPQFSAMKLTTPMFNVSSASKFRRLQLTPTFNVDGPFVPTDRGNFVIAATPIRAAAIRPVITSGLIALSINVVSELHTRCDVRASHMMLQSDWVGTGLIRWKESGIGVKKALVQFPVLDEGQIYAVMAENIAPGQNKLANVWHAGAPTLESVTVRLGWTTGGEGISAGKQIVADWKRDELVWMISRAECE